VGTKERGCGRVRRLKKKLAGEGEKNSQREELSLKSKAERDRKGVSGVSKKKNWRAESEKKQRKGGKYLGAVGKLPPGGKGQTSIAKKMGQAPRGTRKYHLRRRQEGVKKNSSVGSRLN